VNGGVWNELRTVLDQAAAVPALRASLFLLAILAGLSWARRRPGAALLWLTGGGLVALAFWLNQIVVPFGLATDTHLRELWCQVGVNAAGPDAEGGFVVGIPAQESILSTLALAGVPRTALVAFPQGAVLACLGVLIALPLSLERSRTTALFAAALSLGGGVWPGAAPFGATLQKPAEFVLVAAALSLLLVVLRSSSSLRHRRSRAKGRICLILIPLAALVQAWGQAGATLVASLLLVTASVLLASLLRTMLRLASGSAARARNREACLLLLVFSGSGLFWWDPVASVHGFDEARDDDAALLRPMEWLRDNTPATSAILASPDYSAPIAALAGRRVVFPPPPLGENGEDPLPEPFRRNRLRASAAEGRPIARLVQAFSVTHLFLGPGEPDPGPGGGGAGETEPTLRLVRVYVDAKDFRVFAFTTK